MSFSDSRLAGVPLESQAGVDGARRLPELLTKQLSHRSLEPHMPFVDRLAETLKPYQILIALIVGGIGVAAAFFLVPLHINELELRVSNLEKTNTTTQISDLTVRLDKLEDQVGSLNVHETSKRLDQMSYRLDHSLDPSTTMNRMKDLESQLRSIESNQTSLYSAVSDLQKRSLSNPKDETCAELVREAREQNEDFAYGVGIVKRDEELMAKNGCDRPSDK